MAVHRDGKECARGLRVLSGRAPSPHVATAPSALKRQPEQRHNGFAVTEDTSSHPCLARGA